jgi:DNA-directed RNA polymerase subunit M/transcription elongation factor TFIIS
VGPSGIFVGFTTPIVCKQLESKSSFHFRVLDLLLHEAVVGRGKLLLVITMSTAHATYSRANGIYQLGTAACPSCGYWFGITTDPSTDISQCNRCSLHVFPESNEATTFFNFDLTPIESASAGADEISSGADQRTTEQAYCEKCKKHTACFVYAQQTRGADECQTIFYQCTECNKEWLLNS